MSDSAQAWRVRVEELRDAGATPESAAEQIGVSLRGLSVWCERHGVQWPALPSSDSHWTSGGRRR